jgi:DNA-binding CsgD family transcriptional regulator
MRIRRLEDTEQILFVAVLGHRAAMADALPTAAFSELIGSIYDCVLDPGRWDQALQDIKSALDCETAQLSLHDMRNHRFLISKSAGMDADFHAHVAKHLPEIDGVLTRALAVWPSFDDPYVVTRELSRAYLDSSPYIQECQKPRGIVDMMSYFLMHSSARLAMLGVGRHERCGVFTAREVELGALLLPHIRRAVTISNVLDARTIERSRMAEALDGLRCAVVLSDERGAVLHANRAAEEMLRAGSLVTATAGILQARSASAAAELRTAISQAARNEAEIGKTGLATRLTEPDVPPVFAHVLPMTGSELRTRLQPTAAAAIFIGALPDEDDAADLMTAAFGLTPAEKRVLAGLLAGRTLAETAAALGVAQTTAKSQLERIFSKTGVSRQADLILLATRLTPPTELPS